jgi:uncharacterized protein YraI
MRLHNVLPVAHSFKYKKGVVGWTYEQHILKPDSLFCLNPLWSKMKLQLSTIALLFAVASTATPMADADAGAVPASLEKRGQTCDILGNNVNCRSGPGTSYKVLTTFDTERQIYFSCYKVGESISGNE